MAATLLGNLFGHPGSYSWPEPEILEDVFWQVFYPQNYRSACDLPQTNDQSSENQPGTSREGTGGCPGAGAIRHFPGDFPKEFNQFCKNFRRSCRRPDGCSRSAGPSRQSCPEACTNPGPSRQCCAKRDANKEKFEVQVNLRHFKPEEIVVKLTGDNKTVVVDTKHEEKKDEYGSVYRHFVRKYDIPEGHDVSKLESKLSPHGVLTITAPRIRVVDSSGVINIPVIRTDELVEEKVEESDAENSKAEGSVEEKPVEADEKKSEGSDDASFMML